MSISWDLSSEKAGPAKHQEHQLGTGTFLPKLQLMLMMLAGPAWPLAVWEEKSQFPADAPDAWLALAVWEERSQLMLMMLAGPAWRALAVWEESPSSQLMLLMLGWPWQFGKKGPS